MFGPNDTINFNISTFLPGTVQTINVGTHASAAGKGLPIIINPVTIDGYTQPGSSPNTLSNGDNAVLLIQLNGLAALAGGFPMSGLRITAGSSTVRGLVINRFSEAGILLTTNGLTAKGGNIIEGNFIGTDASGTAALANRQDGVYIKAPPGNTIGGTLPGARNVISGNTWSGVNIDFSSSMNLVQGNFIGTKANGTQALGNSFDGITEKGGGSNTIGGTAAGAGNVISGNNGGMEIDSFNGMNLVQGNRIGTDVTGAAALGNLEGGVFIFDSNNTIGGTASGAGNVIAFNGGAGVEVRGKTQTTTGNPIRQNFIYDNTGMGIDLDPAGVTQNDQGDGDAGPNNLQNFPVLTSASSIGGSTTIKGLIDSTTANSSYPITIEFFSNPSCDPSGMGEGRIFLGSTMVAGPGAFTATLGLSVSPGQVVTATATDAHGATSEFSACVMVITPAPATHFAVSAPADATAGSAFSFTVTAMDQFNHMAVGYGGMVHFTSSDGMATLPANSILNNGTGTFSATLKTTGNQTITATDTTDNSIAGAGNTMVAGSPVLVTHFVVSALANANAGSAFSFTVTAMDLFNHTATAYSRTVHFTSSDRMAILPLSSALSNGTGTFRATLKTLGKQTITATDEANSSIMGMSNNILVVGPPTIHVAFGDNCIPLNGTTSMTFTVTNPNATATLSGINVTDALPAG